MTDSVPPVFDLSAAIDKQVATELQPGTPLTMVHMVQLAVLLDEAIAEILNSARTQTNIAPQLVQIAVVASYLRRSDVEGWITARH